ncbi:flap endonuclease GEN-like protein 1 [Cinnamomum micranthum f. kanehirae]|uniref:Flap endonuclease GEN-like 1 n=1 Tax=Cinnamomum micranthum f. kanehirae TaxID=337451 RepID=A0A3S3NC81_9MAGN|nr:flap endonuclease GEN-like protein 1 [Cinnamomum micranthum f. kanehirae]
MGIGGHFWDLLKPYAREENLDFLRDKKVAVDLSFWVVQHETAIKTGNARNPHIRITFFRTINLFSKLGAFPVFVLDGVPSRLKSKARIERFLRATGIDVLPDLPDRGDAVSVQRNPVFTKCIRECVELLELLGMPILQARHEAEALCAWLNSEGHVDACITADSDAFLYGAKCVVKCLRPNSKEPVECYLMSDIEAGLGLRRNHLVAISLLAGSDHDLQGVPGIGVETAVRFVQMFSEDEILNRLHEVGKGDTLLLQGGLNANVDCNITTVENLAKTRSPHCSYCGHPGSKRTHLKVACEYCNVYGHEKCTQKPVGFKCECIDCDKDRRSKEQKKHANWQIKVCHKICAEQNFPNNEIIEMYLSQNHGNFDEKNGPSLSWGNPKIGTLVEFLSYHQRWEPSFVRQRMLPMLSTIFLREMASNPNNGLLLCDQYKFHSIQRVKVKYGHQFYLVKWNKATPYASDALYAITNEQADPQQSESDRVDESIDALDDLLDEADVPHILVDDGTWFLLTDENKELVQAAFPEQVEQFLEEKALKEAKLKRKSCKSESPKSSGKQLSITEFYRSSKVMVQAKHGEDQVKNSEDCMESFVKKSKTTSSPLTSGPGTASAKPVRQRPVRRRLQFE